MFCVDNVFPNKLLEAVVAGVFVTLPNVGAAFTAFTWPNVGVVNVPKPLDCVVVVLNSDGFVSASVLFTPNAKAL